MTDVAPPTGTPGTTAAFDNLGRQTSISTVPSSITVNTAYDALSRPVSQSTSGLGSMLYTRDAAGRMTRIEWPDGFQAEYAHDVTGAVTAIDQHVPPAAATGLAAYGYDNLGQLTGVTRNGGTGAATTYGYDAQARLISLVQNPDGTINDVTLGFSYNPAGQITGRTVSNDGYVHTLGGVSETYYRNGLNQITAINAASVTYDANQNATSVSGNSYGYDAANRLTSATPSGGSAASFVFDPQGRLASSTVGATTTRYQYAGAQLATEYDASGAVTRRYVPGLGLDSVVTAYTGSGVGTRDWLLTDERGSVMALTGPTGTASTINRYDEYGTPASGNSGRFGYTGQPWMAEAGAWHYRARTYLPQIGRFLQPDPIGYQAGVNLYAYVGADPINMVDPLGLDGVHTGVGRAECRLLGGVFTRRTAGSDADHDTCSILPTFGGGGGGGAEGGSGGASVLDDVVVVDNRRHKWPIKRYSRCSSDKTFELIARPGMSAPGAPAARDGFTPRIVLLGNNSISQTVSFANRTIVNTTLPGHDFYPGNVYISVTGTRDRGSVISIVGTGEGANYLYNYAAFHAFFGSMADAVALQCSAALFPG